MINILKIVTSAFIGAAILFNLIIKKQFTKADLLAMTIEGMSVVLMWI